MNSHDLQRFENFRRERNRRRLNEGPKRDLGTNARVLREIEEAEAREARNAQLTREVQEFFEGATRAAASIVSQVSARAEEQQDSAVTQEMSEFLTATIQRAQMFIELMQGIGATPGGDVSLQDVEPQMSKLVGHKLDEFRHAGTAHVSDQHIGLDPFLVDGGEGVANQLEDDEEVAEDQFARLPMPNPDEVAADSHDGPAQPVEEHPFAELLDDQPVGAQTPDVPAAVTWFDRISGEAETLKTALKVLVHYGAMDRDEARAVFQETVVEA